MCFHGEYRGKISTFYLQGRRFEVGGYLCPGCSIFDLQIAVVVFTKQLANIQPKSKVLGMVAFLCVIWTGGFLQTVFVKPLSIIRYGKQQTIVTQGKRDCYAVRAYRTALEIRLLLTCETKAPSRDNCETDMSFCKINSFPFFAHTIFALSYKEDATVCKSINLYSGCVSSIRLILLILLT